mgnify:CR=1 FL=1
MTIDVYTATGTKKGTAALPESLFGAPVNEGLMHQALVMQQGNRRIGTAHAKSRGEVRGSTHKLFRQKGTGRARRGSIRAPLMRGGGKAFGPRPERNFTRSMPRKMRHAALRSCLSMQAKAQVMLGLENYGDEVKTAKATALLQKLPVEIGRRILFVTPERSAPLALSMRNIPNVKVITAAYLNPEDILVSKHIVFVADAITKAEKIFGAVKGKEEAGEKEEKAKEKSKKPKTMKQEKEAKNDADSPLPTPHSQS